MIIFPIGLVHHRALVAERRVVHSHNFFEMDIPHHRVDFRPNHSFLIESVVVAAVGVGAAPVVEGHRLQLPPKLFEDPERHVKH